MQDENWVKGILDRAYLPKVNLNLQNADIGRRGEELNRSLREGDIIFDLPKSIHLIKRGFNGS